MKKSNLKIIGEIECYFCGFKEIVHRHHIIRDSDGGLNEENNLIYLCPNHHFLIHNRKYFIQFTKGILILVEQDNHKNKILPINWKDKPLRNIPIDSINSAKKMGYLIENEINKFSIKSKNRNNFIIEDNN